MYDEYPREYTMAEVIDNFNGVGNVAYIDAMSTDSCGDRRRCICNVNQLCQVDGNWFPEPIHMKGRQADPNSATCVRHY